MDSVCLRPLLGHSSPPRTSRSTGSFRVVSSHSRSLAGFGLIPGHQLKVASDKFYSGKWSANFPGDCNFSLLKVVAWSPVTWVLVRSGFSVLGFTLHTGQRTESCRCARRGRGAWLSGHRPFLCAALTRTTRFLVRKSSSPN